MRPLQRKLNCLVDGAEAEGAAVRLRFSPLSPGVGPIEEVIQLTPAGSLACVKGVGRVLRILRAGRVRPPADPYQLTDCAERAAELVRRCRGARVLLTVARRYRRSLTVWTEAGVERISGVIDYEENSEGLSIHRRGGQSILRIPREGLIRFAPSSNEFLEVISIDVSAGSRLR